MHDLVDIGIHGAPEGPFTTIAGLVLFLLGRVPEAAGELAVIPGWELEVTAIEGHAITEVRLRPLVGSDGRPAG